ncbi:unnamed protein product [Linum tenue]|uniref:Uncharacterized protein n=1 Tax=Linum tenue TaxID=586396 RepID=A0AAV0QXP1_9ROSI|nr:unnamed protein product [Linum tenue]CAI0549666.1 unnamed protein product [Linum tenue]
MIIMGRKVDRRAIPLILLLLLSLPAADSSRPALPAADAPITVPPTHNQTISPSTVRPTCDDEGPICQWLGVTCCHS